MEEHKKGYVFLRTIIRPIFNFYYKTKYVNKEVIPKEGPIIFCGNHLHLYDSGLPILSTKRMIHYMAKKELFEEKGGWFYKMGGCISVDRSVHDGVAKNKAISLLNQGYAVGLFPEGTRNRTDEFLLPFKYGSVSMAQKTGAYIVPFSIIGKYKFRYGLKIKFGKPFKVSKNISLEEANQILYDTIYKLKKDSIQEERKKQIGFGKKALVTGATSGIGKCMALYLDKLGYQVFLLGRNEEKLNEVAKLCYDAKIVVSDLNNTDNCYKVYEELKDEKIDFVVNNAGLGYFGNFLDTKIEEDLEVINVDMISVHILTKLFLKDMYKRKSGHILNVASSAGLMAGPSFSTYFAAKNYTLKLSMAINEEMKKSKSNVVVSSLCPGSVATHFNKKAGGFFNPKSLSPEYVAKYAIDKCLKGKLIIVPTFKMKLELFISRFLSHRFLLNHVYHRERKKAGVE